MSKDEKMKEKAVQFELLKQQVDAIEKQIGELESRTNELMIVQQSINELKGQKGKEILVPIGSGVFLKGTLVSDTQMLVELGANIVTEKSAKETVEIIEKQVQEINKIKDQMRLDMMNFVTEMEKLEPEIIKYYSKQG
jgi:prefoldin alpha subunit